MNWGVVSSGNPYRAPLAAAARASHRGDVFGRGGEASSGWTSGGSSSSSGSSSSKPASNAAVSALALLSFLFFLNLLQQQLSAGQQQTLLFMVNNSNGTRFNRRRRPLLAVAMVKAKQGFNGRTKLTIKTMRNGKIKKRRKPRDLEDYEDNQVDASRFDPGVVKNEKGGGTESDVAEAETELPIMMPGLPHASALQLAAWLQGQLSANQMKNDLVDTLTNCRAVVACSVHKTAQQSDLGGTNMLSEEVIRKLLGEAGEYAEPGHLTEACDDLLEAAGDECTMLAKSFSSLLPATLDKHENPSLLQSNKDLLMIGNAKKDL